MRGARDCHGLAVAAFDVLLLRADATVSRSPSDRGALLHASHAADALSGVNAHLATTCRTLVSRGNPYGTLACAALEVMLCKFDSACTADASDQGALGLVQEFGNRLACVSQHLFSVCQSLVSRGGSGQPSAFAVREPEFQAASGSSSGLDCLDAFWQVSVGDGPTAPRFVPLPPRALGPTLSSEEAARLGSDCSMDKLRDALSRLPRKKTLRKELYRLLNVRILPTPSAAELSAFEESAAHAASLASGSDDDAAELQRAIE